MKNLLKFVYKFTTYLIIGLFVLFFESFVLGQVQLAPQTLGERLDREQRQLAALASLSQNRGRPDSYNSRYIDSEYQRLHFQILASLESRQTVGNTSAEQSTAYRRDTQIILDGLLIEAQNCG